MTANARRTTRFVALIALTSLCGCFSASERRVSHIVRGIAGRGAIDCGVSLFPRIVAKYNACAIGAATERWPFYVRYELNAGSATMTRGIAMNRNGQIFVISTVADSLRGHFNVVQCRTPHLVLDPAIATEKVLTCEP